MKTAKSCKQKRGEESRGEDGGEDRQENGIEDRGEDRQENGGEEH